MKVIRSITITITLKAFQTNSDREKKMKNYGEIRISDFGPYSPKDNVAVFIKKII